MNQKTRIFCNFNLKNGFLEGKIVNYIKNMEYKNSAFLDFTKNAEYFRILYDKKQINCYSPDIKESLNFKEISNFVKKSSLSSHYIEEKFKKKYFKKKNNFKIIIINESFLAMKIFISALYFQKKIDFKAIISLISETSASVKFDFPLSLYKKNSDHNFGYRFLEIKILNSSNSISNLNSFQSDHFLLYENVIVSKKKIKNVVLLENPKIDILSAKGILIRKNGYFSFIFCSKIIMFRYYCILIDFFKFLNFFNFFLSKELDSPIITSLVYKTYDNILLNKERILSDIFINQKNNIFKNLFLKNCFDIKKENIPFRIFLMDAFLYFFLNFIVEKKSIKYHSMRLQNKNLRKIKIFMLVLNLKEFYNFMKRYFSSVTKNRRFDFRNSYIEKKFFYLKNFLYSSLLRKTSRLKIAIKFQAKKNKIEIALNTDLRLCGETLSVHISSLDIQKKIMFVKIFSFWQIITFKWDPKKALSLKYYHYVYPDYTFLKLACKFSVTASNVDWKKLFQTDQFNEKMVLSLLWNNSNLLNYYKRFENFENQRFPIFTMIRLFFGYLGTKKLIFQKRILQKQLYYIKSYKLRSLKKLSFLLILLKIFLKKLVYYPGNLL
jgi:hypothetical protein